MREIVNGTFYVTRAGCPWRLLPNDLPPWGTIYRWFAAWRDDGRFERINHALVIADRERVGREASPSAAIIDSQSVKTTEAAGPRGYDAGKKINGRKRHALVDTDGRGLVLEPHPASIQDRDGGEPLLRASRRIFPFIQRVFADSGYAGEKVAKTKAGQLHEAFLRLQKCLPVFCIKGMLGIASAVHHDLHCHCQNSHRIAAGISTTQQGFT